MPLINQGSYYEEAGFFAVHFLPRTGYVAHLSPGGFLAVKLNATQSDQPRQGKLSVAGEAKKERRWGGKRNSARRPRRRSHGT